MNSQPADSPYSYHTYHTTTTFGSAVLDSAANALAYRTAFTNDTVALAPLQHLFLLGSRALSAASAGSWPEAIVVAVAVSAALRFRVHLPHQKMTTQSFCIHPDKPVVILFWEMHLKFSKTSCFQ